MPLQPTTLVGQEVQNKIRGGRDQAYASTMRWYLDRVTDEFSNRPNRMLPSSSGSPHVPDTEESLRARKNAAHAKIESIQNEMKIVQAEAAAGEHKLSSQAEMDMQGAQIAAALSENCTGSWKKMTEDHQGQLGDLMGNSGDMSRMEGFSSGQGVRPAIPQAFKEAAEQTMTTQPWGAA